MIVMCHDVFYFSFYIFSTMYQGRASFSLQATQKQAVGQIRPLGHSLLTPGVEVSIGAEGILNSLSSEGRCPR